MMTLVSAVKAVAGFDQASHRFRTPPLATKLGHPVKVMANIGKAEALETKNLSTSEKCDRIMELFNMNWFEDIACIHIAQGESGRGIIQNTSLL